MKTHTVMKKLSIIVALAVFALAGNAQGFFEMGPKVGINTTKISANIGDYDQETITKFQVGAFARISIGPLYAQPEAYFNSREYIYLDNLNATTKEKFNLKTIDVPALVGIKIINQETMNVRIMAGPVFSFLTEKNAKEQLQEDNIKKARLGWQYGAGIDFMFLTLDARMESHSEKFAPSYDKNGIFIISLGAKLF